MVWSMSSMQSCCHRIPKQNEDGSCCGAGTVDAETGTCVVEDDGRPDADGDFIITIGDILIILGYFGHDCD